MKRARDGMNWVERAVSSFMLAVNVLIVMMAVGEVMLAIWMRDWSRLIVPLFCIWVLIMSLSVEVEKLKKKRIFVVLKDRNW